MITASAHLPIVAELINDSQDALVALSRDGRVLLWNRGAEALFGYTAQDVLGQDLAELISPVELNGDALRTDALRDLAGTRRLQAMARRKDGSLLRVEFSLRSVDLPGSEP